jgi:hypothetical protein
MVVIPRKIGESMNVTIAIITALLPPPSLRVNSPRKNNVTELINAGSNLKTKSESPRKYFQAASTQMDNGG